MPKYTVEQFSNLYRQANPDLDDLDDADIINIITKDDPELMGEVDRDDLARSMRTVRMKKISQQRQKQFSTLSGYSRFMSGVGQGMLDPIMGVKQLLGGDTEKFKEDKAAYMEASEGDVLAGTGEIIGSIAATAPIPGLTGAKLASKVAPAAGKALIGTGAAVGTGAGFGLAEHVDENETRLRNTAFGALFGAGGALIGKVGAKAFNALKGRYVNASAQELMDLSKKYDIPLSLGDITGQGRSTEKLLEGVPLTGMGGFRREGAEKVQEAIKKKAGTIGDDWDEAIQGSLERKSKAGRAQAKKNYNRVEELSAGTSVKPSNAIDAAARHESDVAGSIMGSETNPFSKIRENLSKKDRTFTELRKDRSDLGKAATKASQSGDTNLSRQFMEIREGVEQDIEKLVGKHSEVGSIPKKNMIGKGKIDDRRLIKTQTDELKGAFHKAQKHYKEKVVPYKQREILNALKSDTPDEIFDKFIKKGKADRASNFYNLLDEKGQKALRDGFLDNAIQGATTNGVTSPAKLAGYIERMSKPKDSLFKGSDLKELSGFAKIMRHAERYGQLNESPSNGMQLIPYLKTAAVGAAGYGSAVNLPATIAGIGAVGTVTQLMSFMRTKGKGLLLASSKYKAGSPKLEKAIEGFINNLPKGGAVTGIELTED